MGGFEGEHAVEEIGDAGRGGGGPSGGCGRRGRSGAGCRGRRRGTGNGRCGRGSGGVAEFFGEQRREDFGERGGFGDAGGFFGHRGGGAVFGDTGVVSGSEQVRKFFDLEIERFGVSAGCAQQANAPVGPAHVVQELFRRAFGRGQRCAVQGDSARPERGGSVSRKSEREGPQPGEAPR